jgi:hypothetical protein
MSYGFHAGCRTPLRTTHRLRRRIDRRDGDLESSKPVPPTIHGLKYSLFYGRRGMREVGYGNERGKGDHKHLREIEMPYRFTSVEQLMVDFWRDVDNARSD